MSGAGGKRSSGGDSPPGPPEKKMKKEEKTTTTLIEPIRIGGVSSTVSFHRCLMFKLLLEDEHLMFSSAGGDGHEGHSVQKQEAV